MIRRFVVILAVLSLGVAGCGSSDSGAGGDARRVLVDYNHDEFANFYMGNFPIFLKVHAGDTIEFRQAWTGEPHTVTMGQVVQALGNAMSGYFDGTKAIPMDEPEDVAAAAKDIPQFFADTSGEGHASSEDQLNQTGAQPCFMEKGPLPTDGKPCPRVEQPPFNGRQAFYNSGFIPYEGNNGNKFTVELSDDIAEGNYFYFCLIHGAPMGGYIQVRPETEDIPSQGDVNKQARKEIDAVTARVAKAHKAAQKGEGKDAGIDVLAGTEPEEPKFPFGGTLEFYPKVLRAKVGQKVTWDVNGHTVSFNVPKYGPQIIIEDDGTVKLNPKAYEPVNVPEPPETDQEDEDAPTPVVDAGDYVPGKFISTGLSDFNLSLRFTKAGTYKYACLVHPRMIGEVVVS